MIIEFLKKPKNTGSIIPSSKYLVDEMISHVDQSSVVIELGAGSGVITKRLSSLNSVNVIYSYENNISFHDKLKKIDKTICCNDLFSMKDTHANEKVNVIISSIPFVNFSSDARSKALDEISSVLSDDGILIQYTYRNRCPFGESFLKKKNLQIKKTKKVWFNFPPATVYVYERIKK